MPDPTAEELLERFRGIPDDEFVRMLVHDLRGPLNLSLRVCGAAWETKGVHALGDTNAPAPARLRVKVRLWGDGHRPGPRHVCAEPPSARPPRSCPQKAEARSTPTTAW